jgi:hypothetical protein
VRFRYKLEGRDADWQDAGTRRQAFYSDLRPGQYRFRVIACNNDGVWNDEGIDAVTVSEGKEGHFGLQGMRERAVRIGAKLTLASSANSGTEITLVVPGDIAFRISPVLIET